MERTPHLSCHQFICSRGTDMQYSCGPTTGYERQDAVAAASGATSSASATATVADADAALSTAAAATATTSVSSFASASVASSCYAAVAEPATAAHTAA